MALRAAVPTSTVTAADFQDTWSKEDCPEVNGTVTIQWPKPGKNLASKTRQPASNSGKYPNIFHHTS